MEISPATKNETIEITMKITTAGTNDHYEKKLMVEKVFVQNKMEKMLVDYYMLAMDKDTPN